MHSSFRHRLHATSRSRATSLVLVLLAAATLAGGADAHAQQIRARVVDEHSRSALVDATVTLFAAADSTRIEQVGTAADGFFIVRAPGPGSYRILVELLGYAPVEREVDLREQAELTVPAFVLESQVITLDRLVAEGRPRTFAARSPVASRRTGLLTGERLATLQRRGTSMEAAVRELGASLRVRHFLIPGMVRSMTCVESRRGLPSFRAGVGGDDTCAMITIVLDGMTMHDPMGFFQYLNVAQFESIEYLPGPDAARYGFEASSAGALVLWTRRRGPYRSSARDGSHYEQ